MMNEIKLNGSVTIDLNSFLEIQTKANECNDATYFKDFYCEETKKLRELAVRMAIDTYRIHTRTLAQCLMLGNDVQCCIYDVKYKEIKKAGIDDEFTKNIIRKVFVEESNAEVVMGNKVEDSDC